MNLGVPDVNATAAIESNVLVLNRLYMAMHVVNVRRAFRLLFKSYAEVISLEEDRYSSYSFESWVELSRLRDEWKSDPNEDWVRAVSLDIRVPRIIRLLTYDRVPQRGVRFNRRNIYARDGSRCQYCGKRFVTQELSLDHVVPRARGGAATWDNIVCCCTSCNVKKGGRTPREAHMHLVRPPKRPKCSPIITVRLGSAKYQSWKTFLDNAYWSVELK